MRCSGMVGWIGLVGLSLAGCDSDFSTRCLIPVGGDVCFDGVVIEPDAAVDDGGSDAVDAGSATDAGADARVEMDASADAGSDAAMPSLARFCELQFANARAFADSCTCGERGDQDAIDGFVQAVMLYRGTSACIDALSNQAVRYVPEAATECARRFNAQFALPQGADRCTAEGIDILGLEAVVGKGAQFIAQLPECRAAFVGSVPRDGSCTASLECADGLRCLPMPGLPLDAIGGPRTCQTARGPVDPCATNSDCADGLVCAGTRNPGRTCIPTGPNQLRPLGGNCEAPLECENGGVCSSNLCMMTTVEVVCEQ